MAASRLIILGVAVAAAGGAGYVAKNMAAPQPVEVVNAGPQEPAVPLTEVLVLASDVPMGASVNGHLSWQAWPKDNVGAGFITRSADPEALDQLKDSLARVAMYSGEPLRRSKLVGDGQSFMSSILPAGKRAVATRIAADTSAGGFILPNDYVDVIMTRRSEAESGGSGYVTETILQNIKVLAIDQAIQEDEEGRRVKVGDTATLELSPQQAEIITVAQQMADRLTLSLRSVADAQQKPDGEADYLVSGNGRRGTIRLIKAGEMTETGARK